MAFEGVDRKRFAFLLHYGVSDDELRRFFADCRLQLIQKGAKVQNLPYGHSERIRILTQALSAATDQVVRKWFSKHLEMTDPEPVESALSTFREYEEIGETLPKDQAERLSRSCLVSLFSDKPPEDLLTFLRSPIGGVVPEVQGDQGPQAPSSVAKPVEAPELLSPSLAASLVALVEGRDPDESLADLPSEIATFLAGLHAVKQGRVEEANSAIQSLGDRPEAKRVLEEFSRSRAKVPALHIDQPCGILPARVAVHFTVDDFDIERDEVVGICTSSSSPTTVFVRPFAIKTGVGEFHAITREQCEALFPASGDLISFVGANYPRQPQRGEVGIWKVSPNPNATPAHRTRFHLSSERTPLYEVRDVPYRSTEHDAVREFIKDQLSTLGGGRNRSVLFLLRDGVIVGCPPGKDLCRDDGFEGGLPCWRSLEALQFEGRRLVPGPLPESIRYECETLGSSLRKLFASLKPGPDKPTKAQLRKLQELVSSGEAALNADRAARLRAELSVIEEQDEAMAVLLEEVMKDEHVAARISQAVEKETASRVEGNERLRAETTRLEKLHAAAIEKQRKLEREQKALAPAIAKAIRASFEKAKGDAIGTLAQAVVFKALMDEVGESTKTDDARTTKRERISSVPVRIAQKVAALSVPELLQSLGLAPRQAKAIGVAGEVAMKAGLILALQGKVGRLAAEAWGAHLSQECRVIECIIGLCDDYPVRDVMEQNPPAVVILDANISPFEVYARTLVDGLQRHLLNGADDNRMPATLVSLSHGVAALPIPESLQSISVCLSLDSAPVFLPEGEASSMLEEARTANEVPDWLSDHWKPARKRLLIALAALGPEDLALALSVMRPAVGEN